MNEYMEKANEVAKENLVSNEGGPFGACVVKNEIIIGIGANRVISCNDPTAHAEIIAIREACKAIGSYDLKGCILYTTCYPCPMCLSAIIWANIDKVFYGNTKEDAAKIGFRDDDIYEFIKGNNSCVKLQLECLEREKTIEVFNQFLEKNDKIIY